MWFVFSLLKHFFERGKYCQLMLGRNCQQITELRSLLQVRPIFVCEAVYLVSGLFKRKGRRDKCSGLGQSQADGASCQSHIALSLSYCTLRPLSFLLPGTVPYLFISPFRRRPRGSETDPPSDRPPTIFYLDCLFDVSIESFSSVLYPILGLRVTEKPLRTINLSRRYSNVPFLQ